MVPAERLELPTVGLQNQCSAIELHGHIGICQQKPFCTELPISAITTSLGRCHLPVVPNLPRLGWIPVFVEPASFIPLGWCRSFSGCISIAGSLRWNLIPFYEGTYATPPTFLLSLYVRPLLYIT